MHISGRPFVTISICDLYDIPEPDIKKTKIRIYLQKSKKLELPLLMDDLKIFAKSEREIKGLVSTVQILSKDIGMEFGIKKCGVLVLKRGKVVSSEGAEMPDVERIKEAEKNGYIDT